VKIFSRSFMNNGAATERLSTVSRISPLPASIGVPPDGRRSVLNVQGKKSLL
jgi:hypothetical protein